MRTVRTHCGNRKFRALRLDAGIFAWALEGYSRKAHIVVCTKELVKNTTIVVDAAPFLQWHFLLPLGKKRDLKAG